jgi:hypothetical protein
MGSQPLVDGGIKDCELERNVLRYLLLFISLGLASSRTTAGIAFTVWYSAPSLGLGPRAEGGSEWRRLLNKRIVESWHFTWAQQIHCLQRPAIVIIILLLLYFGPTGETSLYAVLGQYWQHKVRGPVGTLVITKTPGLVMETSTQYCWYLPPRYPTQLLP